MKKLLVAVAMVLSTFAVFGEVAETRYSSDGGETWTEGTLTAAVTAANKNADTIIELNKNLNLGVLEFNKANQFVTIRSNTEGTGRFTFTRTANASGSAGANFIANAKGVKLKIENIRVDLRDTTGNVIATIKEGASENSVVTLGKGAEIFSSTMSPDQTSGGLDDTSLVQILGYSSSLVIDGGVIHSLANANRLIWPERNSASFVLRSGGISNCTIRAKAGATGDKNAAIIDVYSYKTAFTMTGGFVKDNRIIGTQTACIINVGNGSTVDISGGEISGNTFKASAMGAITVNGSGTTLQLSGSPVIQNNKLNGSTEKNILTTSSGAIVQNGDLTEGAHVGVSNGSKEGDSFGSISEAGFTGAEHFHLDGKSFAGFADGTTLKWATYTDVTVAFSGTLTMDDWVVDETPSEPSGLTVNYGTLVYKYYSDAACTQPLAERPSEIGVYYVRGEVAAGVDADRNRWAAAASDAVSFTIKSGEKEVVQTTVEGTLVIEDWYRDATPNEPTGLTLTSGHGELVYKYYAESACETKLAVVPNVIGTYYVRGEVAAGEDENYIWTAWNSNPVAFQVLQPWYVIDAPTVNAGLIYNGEEQTGVGPESDYYTLDDAVKTAAGEYTAIATLKTKGQEHELEWLDGTKTPKEFPWSIAKVQVALTGKVTIQDWMQGDTPAPSGVTASFGEVQYRYYLDAGCTQAVEGIPTKLGTYFVRAEVEDDSNIIGAVSEAARVQLVKYYAPADKPEGATFFARLLNDERLVTGAAAEKYATGADLVFNAGKREQIFVFTNAAEAATFKTKRRGVADILVIAGGGAGGYNAGAGGGAGGAVYMTDVPLNGEYAITVGKGGVSSDNDDTHSTNGENSSISNATEAVVDVAIGGGAGGGYNNNNKPDIKTAICTGYDGGSGGGGYKNYAGGAGAAGQGNAGYGSDSANPGGGGGAGEAATSKDGGAGRTFYLLGYAEAFAGGGGAGSSAFSGEGAGGLGGGGKGGVRNESTVTSLPGEDGLGAGGGGGGGGTATAKKEAGKGGDGIVIIRYTAEPMGLMLLLQ